MQPRPWLCPERNALSDSQTERVIVHFRRSNLGASTGEWFFFLFFFVHEFNTDVSTWRQAVLFSYEDVGYFFSGSSEWLWPNDKQQLDLWIKPSVALVTIFDGFNTNSTLLRPPPHPTPTSITALIFLIIHRCRPYTLFIGSYIYDSGIIRLLSKMAISLYGSWRHSYDVHDLITRIHHHVKKGNSFLLHEGPLLDMPESICHLFSPNVHLRYASAWNTSTAGLSELSDVSLGWKARSQRIASLISSHNLERGKTFLFLSVFLPWISFFFLYPRL